MKASACTPREPLRGPQRGQGPRLRNPDLSPYCYLIHNGLYDVIECECLQIGSLFFFLSNCFIVFIFLMMAYDSAETSNKIMCSIIVAMLFAVRIYRSSVHCLPKYIGLRQGFLTWCASTPRGVEINLRGCWGGHICGGQRFVH